METPKQRPLYMSAAFVNGQVMAMISVVAAITNAHPEPDVLRAEIARQLEQLRTASIPTAMPDDFFLGIDQVEKDLASLRAGT